MTRWFRRFLGQTFEGRELMTEATLEALALEIAQTRAALADVFQEVSLAMQALDLIQARCAQALNPSRPTMDQVGKTPLTPAEAQTIAQSLPPLSQHGAGPAHAGAARVQPATLTRESRQREAG